jgi:quinol monooxygenase YgiN
MFMRFVQIPIRPEAVEAYTSFYDYRVAPTLRKVDGCLFARLIQDSSSESVLLSFTVWSSPEAAHAYEQSGLFDKLVAENAPFIEDTTQWKVQLSDDMRLEYKPVLDEPDVRAMPVVAGTVMGNPAEQIGDYTYVRIFSLRLNPGMLEEAGNFYDEIATPQLLKVAGCRGAYMIALNNDEIFSVTIWESKQHADAYEESGLFKRITDQARPFLSTLTKWKMSLDPEKQSEILTSEDGSVKGYRIVTGQKI